MNFPCELFINSKYKESVRCEATNARSNNRCNKLVNGYSPAYCTAHRNNQDPSTGWAWISRDESLILNIIRRHHTTTQYLEGLQRFDLAARVDDIGRGVERVELIDDEDEDEGEGESESDDEDNGRFRVVRGGISRIVINGVRIGDARDGYEEGDAQEVADIATIEAEVAEVLSEGEMEHLEERALMVYEQRFLDLW